MPDYAHTAEDEHGRPLPVESGKWQLLAVHLLNVAELAAKFAAPFGAEAEARLAGLLHDLGKYREEFQSYLRGERASSAETQHAIFGAAWAAAATEAHAFRHRFNHTRPALRSGARWGTGRCWRAPPTGRGWPAASL